MYSSSDENIYEVIELYLSGILPENERMLFEEQLISDSALQHKVEVCKTAKELILQNKLKGLKSIMAEEQTKADQNGPFNKGWTFLILLAVISSGSYLLVRNNSSSEIEKSEHIKNNIVSTESAPNIPQQGSEAKNTNAAHPLKSNTIPDKKTDNQLSITKNDIVAIAPDIEQGQPLTSKENILKPDISTNTIAEPKNDIVPPPSNKCEGVVISAQLLVQEPCNGSNNGIIEIKGFKGGTSPYKTTLNGSGSEEENIFRDLNQGTYRVDVTDYNGCKHQFNPLILKGKVCKLDYDFNPGRGEEWHGPMVTQASKLSIIDKTGNQIYSRQMTDGEQCTWSGYSETGKLELGYFIYIIENRDGNVIKGSITVTE